MSFANGRDDRDVVRKDERGHVLPEFFYKGRWYQCRKTNGSLSFPNWRRDIECLKKRKHSCLQPHGESCGVFLLCAVVLAWIWRRTSRCPKGRKRACCRFFRTCFTGERWSGCLQRRHYACSLPASKTGANLRTTMSVSN